MPRLGLIRQVELVCAGFNATVGIAVTAFSLTQPHTLRPPASAALLAVAFVFVQIVQIRTARRVRSAGCAARRRPLLGEIEKPQVRGHPFIIALCRSKLILVGGRSVDRETIDRLASLANTSYELSCVLALAVASSPPGELTGDQMDALTDLSYKILINIAEMREILAPAPDQPTTGQN